MDTRKIVATISRLAQMDPLDEAVAQTVQILTHEVNLLSSEKPASRQGSFDDTSAKSDLKVIGEQIKKLHSAAIVPARNYARMTSILVGLHRAHEASGRPAYAHLRPRIANIIEKVAGVFSEIDTVQDLEKPLEAIEKAVHGLYGPSQSNNDAYMFDRKGKGHHGESGSK